MFKRVTILQNQSLFDISLQEFGSVEGLFNLLLANPGMQIDSDIPSGTILKLDGEVIRPEVVDYYIKNGIKPATGGLDTLQTYTRPEGDKVIM